MFACTGFRTPNAIKRAVTTTVVTVTRVSWAMRGSLLLDAPGRRESGEKKAIGIPVS
jgi:hypothetical protein